MAYQEYLSNMSTYQILLTSLMKKRWRSLKKMKNRIYKKGKF